MRRVGYKCIDLLSIILYRIYIKHRLALKVQMGFSLSKIFNWLKPKPVPPPAPVVPPPSAPIVPQQSSVLELPHLYQKNEAEIVAYIQEQLKAGALLEGSKALHDVCGKGWQQAATLLIDSGADINLSIPAGYRHATTPFHSAAASGNPDLMAELLKRGAKGAAVDENKHDALYHYITSYDRDFDALKTPEGQARDRQAFKILLGLGLADDSLTNSYVYTGRRHLAPLCPQVEEALKFETAIKAKDYETVNTMMAAGMKPDTGADLGGVAGLRIAAGQNDLMMMGILMREGADVKRFSNGFDALHAAAISGSRDAFLKVVGAGVNTDGVIYAYDRYEDTTIVEVAGMCKTDPGMADFVKDVLARKKEVIAEYEATKQKFLHPYDDIKLVTDHTVAVHKPLHFRPRTPAA